MIDVPAMRLVDQLQTKLKLSRRVGLRGYLAKGGIGHAGVGRSELDMIEGIEELRAELKFYTVRPFETP